MGRGRWKEQVKCKWWSATEGGRRWRILRCMPTPCHDQSTRWMIYFPAPILSPGKKKKKIYIPLNYWGFYFERRMWLWVCGCVGGKEWPSDVAIMKLKMSVLILILFLSPLIAPLFSSPFCGKCTEYTDIIKKKKKERNLWETLADTFTKPLFLMCTTCLWSCYFANFCKHLKHSVFFELHDSFCLYIWEFETTGKDIIRWNCGSHWKRRWTFGEKFCTRRSCCQEENIWQFYKNKRWLRRCFQIKHEFELNCTTVVAFP